MADTVRTLSALQTLLADNTAGDISAQDIRDMLVSVYAMTEIETITLGADGTFTFDSIPANWKDLVITGTLRDDSTAAVVNSIQIQVGNSTLDTGSNYSYGVTSIRSNGDGVLVTEADTDSKWLGLRNCIADGAAAGTSTPLNLEIFDYADTTFFRNFLARGFTWSGTTDGRTTFGAGQWENAADAIDIVEISGDAGGDFKAGSQLTLYGRGSL